jgi:probable rRNA maturation factor
VKVEIINSQKSLKISKLQVKRIVKAVLALESRCYDEAAIHFVTQSKICELHAQFFNDPSPTDCISFPMDEEEQGGYKILGEVFVCPQTAVEYAEKHQKDPYEETTLYLVHGLLHLLGYDDLDKRERLKMRAAEKKQMAHLKELQLVLRGRT